MVVIHHLLVDVVVASLEMVGELVRVAHHIIVAHVAVRPTVMPRILLPQMLRRERRCAAIAATIRILRLLVAVDVPDAGDRLQPRGDSGRTADAANNANAPNPNMDGGQGRHRRPMRCWPPSIPKRPASCRYCEHRWTEAAAGTTCWSGRTCWPHRGSFPGCDSGRCRRRGCNCYCCRCYRRWHQPTTPRRTWEESTGPRKLEYHRRRRCCCVQRTHPHPRRDCYGTTNSVHQTLCVKKKSSCA